MLATVGIVAGVLATTAAAQLPSTTDPRFGLSPGLDNPGVAKHGVDLLAHLNKSAGFFNPANPADFGFINSDLAFQGSHAFVGNFNGFQIYNIANPSSPSLVTAVVCPGGQGEVSVYGNLLFMSVEETRGRLDCGTQGTTGTVDPARFRGVRIFDISNLSAPVQVAAVQTCRGSHTHTIFKSPSDAANLYVYNSGTSGVRPAAELAGCENAALTTAPVTSGNPTQWRIDVIRVPLAAPQNAAIVSQPRIFMDPATGAFNGLQNTQAGALHPSGTAYSPLPNTNTCHDITAYAEIGLAAGACQGNGVLLDISDPVNPKRLDAVADPNYSYWHGATFSNDGKKIVFTDEWGGGTTPRCRTTDQLAWGANAIYELVDGKMVFRSYYKLPVAQTNQENCVAHLPSVVPVPGRDILVQAWYQGGVSMFDFTDPANPQEIGYYDRGPISAASLVLGGLWSAYWYNGAVYGSELARGFDVFGLTTTSQLSVNELAAAAEVQFDRLTPQNQTRYQHRPSFAVARSFRDQLVRAGTIDAKTLAQVDKFIDRAEAFSSGPQARAAKANLHALAQQLKGQARFANLADALEGLARS